MTSNEQVIEKAARVLQDVWQIAGRSSACEKEARALDAAGLLVSELHERAIEAAKKYALYHGPGPKALDNAPQGVLEVGRAALASEKKAQERWEMTWTRHLGSEMASFSERGGPRGFSVSEITWREAEAIRAALNALDSRESGK